MTLVGSIGIGSSGFLVSLMVNELIGNSIHLVAVPVPPNFLHKRLFRDQRIQYSLRANEDLLHAKPRLVVCKENSTKPLACG